MRYCKESGRVITDEDENLQRGMIRHLTYRAGIRQWQKYIDELSAPDYWQRILGRYHGSL